MLLRRGRHRQLPPRPGGARELPARSVRLVVPPRSTSSSARRPSSCSSCRALSASQLAAPAFVEAGACATTTRQRIHGRAITSCACCPAAPADPLLALDSADGAAARAARRGAPERDRAAARASAAATTAAASRGARRQRRRERCCARPPPAPARRGAARAAWRHHRALRLGPRISRVVGRDCTAASPPCSAVDELRAAMRRPGSRSTTAASWCVGVAALALVIALSTDAIDLDPARARRSAGLPRRLRGHAIVVRSRDASATASAASCIAAGIDVCGVDTRRGGAARPCALRGHRRAPCGDASAGRRPCAALGVQRRQRYLFCVDRRTTSRTSRPRWSHAPRIPDCASCCACFDHGPRASASSGSRRLRRPSTQRRRPGRARIRGGRARPRRDRRDPHARRACCSSRAWASSTRRSASIERDGALRVLSRERARRGALGSRGTTSGSSRTTCVTVVGTQLGLAQLAGR